MNESPFRISGKARKEKKKELSSLKSYVKYFWHYEDIERLYGSGSEYNECNKKISNAEEEIRILESELAESSVAIKRDDILNELGLT
jgi:hypothetical protein